MTAKRAKASTRPTTSAASEVFVALLRGVNVGGTRKVPMKELVTVAERAGFDAVRTYIQSGNVVLQSALDGAAVEATLEAAIEAHFGFAVPIVARRASEWRTFAGGSPFPEADRDRPNLVLLGLCKSAPARGAKEHIERYAKAGERVHVSPRGVWIDFPNGSGGSKITPAVLDRAVGATVTTRNVRTVRALAAMLEER
jgi:uncharacterized protein (DUF1697 family)